MRDGQQMRIAHNRNLSGQTLRERFNDIKLRYEFGPTTVIVGLIVIAVSISLVYLAHFNKVATKGYDLKRLEADHSQLMDQYEIRNMRLAEAKSLNNIVQNDRLSAMRHPNSVIFVRSNTALAKR